jgi:hypothetical protein
MPNLLHPNILLPSAPYCPGMLESHQRSISSYHFSSFFLFWGLHVCGADFSSNNL